MICRKIELVDWLCDAKVNAGDENGHGVAHTSPNEFLFPVTYLYISDDIDGADDCVMVKKEMDGLTLKATNFIINLMH